MRLLNKSQVPTAYVYIKQNKALHSFTFWFAVFTVYTLLNIHVLVFSIFSHSSYAWGFLFLSLLSLESFLLGSHHFAVQVLRFSLGQKPGKFLTFSVPMVLYRNHMVTTFRWSHHPMICKRLFCMSLFT